MMKLRDKFSSFEEFNSWWHKETQKHVDIHSIYWDGQFDDIPYVMWEENGECDESPLST